MASDGVTERRLAASWASIPPIRICCQTHRAGAASCWASRATSRSTSAASSSRATRLTNACRSKTPPWQDRTVIEWDKDDIDALGMLKVDVLGLGMLTCIRKAFDLVADAQRPRRSRSPTIPRGPRVYDMICQADTVGVFQIESRAQMPCCRASSRATSTTW